MNKSRSGFSIIELIIVIVIIAILASIAFVSYGWMRRDAYDAKVHAAMNQAEKALYAFSTKNSPPPADYNWDVKEELVAKGYVPQGFFEQLESGNPIAGKLEKRQYLTSKENVFTWGYGLGVSWCGGKTCACIQWRNSRL